MAAAPALSSLQTLRNLFGSQTPSKPSVTIHCPTYHSRPLLSTTLSDDKHGIILGARMTNAELLSDDSTATTSNPKRIIINASGKIVEYQFPAGRLTIKEEPPDVLLVHPDVDPQLSNLEVWFQRPKDIVRKLLSGALDLGIVGLDTLGEHGQEMRAQGVTEDRPVLLKSLSGGFRRGKLTALMGVSGAGKTTLMDVLAGRKTGGYIDGDISISGYPKKQETFARISGYCEQNDIHSPHVTDYESLGYSAWLRLSSEVDRKTSKILPYAGLGNMNPTFGVRHEKLQWFLDAAQTHPNELYTVGDYGYLGTTVTTVNNFGDAVSPLLNYIDGIQAQSSYLTVGGGLGINHYNGGIIPPTLMDLNSTIFRRMCCSHQILWISLLMAGSLLLFDPCIRSIIKIIISFIHSSDGNYIKLDTLMSLMQFFGLGQSRAPLFCSVGITSETRKLPYELLIMMMGAACWLLRSFKGSKHDVNSALVRLKENLATQQIPSPNTLFQAKFSTQEFSLEVVTSGGGCTQIFLFVVAIFLVGILFTVLAESSKKKTMDESSFRKKNLDQHLKLRAIIPKDSKLRDEGFMVKIKARIQNHGEGKYNDPRVGFDHKFFSLENELLEITCKLRAKDDDEYKESMSYLLLLVEGVMKQEQHCHGETWAVQPFF